MADDFSPNKCFRIKIKFGNKREPIVPTKTEEQKEIERAQISFDFLRSLGKFLRPKTAEEKSDDSNDSVSCCSGESDNSVDFSDSPEEEVRIPLNYMPMINPM